MGHVGQCTTFPAAFTLFYFIIFLFCYVFYHFGDEIKFIISKRLLLAAISH